MGWRTRHGVHRDGTVLGVGAIHRFRRRDPFVGVERLPHSEEVVDMGVMKHEDGIKGFLAPQHVSESDVRRDEEIKHTGVFSMAHVTGPWQTVGRDAPDVQVHEVVYTLQTARLRVLGVELFMILQWLKTLGIQQLDLIALYLLCEWLLISIQSLASVKSIPVETTS